MGQREIKFRAWNIQQNKFIEIGLLDFHRVEHVCVATFGTAPHEYPHTYPSDENILMQFTGRKDMNGNPIYEGDIIQQHPASKYRCWEVKYSISNGFDLSETADYEIIGNIYEHPELLKR